MGNETEDSYEMFNLQGTPGKPFLVTVELNNCAIEMEIDTGASLSIISEEIYNSLWATESRPKLQPTTVKLHTYTKESITVLWSITIEVCYKGQSKALPLLVVAGDPVYYLMELKLDWQELYQINQSEMTLKTILDKHKSVFNDKLGEAVGITAKLHASSNTKPYFCRCDGINAMGLIRLTHANAFGIYVTLAKPTIRDTIDCGFSSPFPPSYRRSCPSFF